MAFHGGLPVADGPYHFGEFELDRERFELRRNGDALKLERIPLELLLLLAERQGAVVTRQEIIDSLWGKDVFVDTEHGINTAIRKIRQTLKDDPEQPRFVQTVTGKGYRFVAEINGTPPEPPRAAPQTLEAPLAPPPAWGRPPRPSSAAEVSLRARAIVALPLLLATAAALTLLFRSQIFPNRAAQIHSIAVLPLVNLSGDATQDYVADGMTDELITSLAKNRNLRVVSRTSAMQYKGVKRPLPDIARELNVDGILEGSIERAPNSVHMTVQLIYAPTDSHVWAESYDRDLSVAIFLPEELSQTIAQEVKAAVSPPTRQHSISPEAHDAYLQGLYFWYRGDFDHSKQYFQKAIDLQPDYAAAWAGLGISYGGQAGGDTPPQAAFAKDEENSKKALDLDDSVAEAPQSMAALYLFRAWDWNHAEAEARRAIELDPNLAGAHH